jgi:hypothetical protein
MFAFSSALGSIVSALFLFASIYIYVSLIRQIGTRRSTAIAESTKTFALPEAVGALILVSLFFWLIAASFSSQPHDLTTSGIIANEVIFMGVVGLVLAHLKLRGFDLDSLGGFSAINFPRAATAGVILLVAAWPLLALADWITQLIFGSGSSKQEIVDLFNQSQALEQRIVIIVIAVAVAPVAEEFLFRFFLYGVFKRYLGRALGLLLNAGLFAAVHAHLPSFAPLFVLGCCFTLAYEWSGSILVSMTMHSLFNSLQLALLAFPQLSQQ